MENNVKDEQFTAPVEETAIEQQVEKKPWRKTRWGKALIAATGAIVLGVCGYVMFKKLKGTTAETATDNAVEVEEQKETPRDNNNRRDRFEARRERWNNQQ